MYLSGILNKFVGKGSIPNNPVIPKEFNLANVAANGTVCIFDDTTNTISMNGSTSGTFGAFYQIDMKRILKTCTWQLLGIVWFMSYALITGGDLWYTFGLAIASIPAGSVMYYCHEWLWDKVGNAEHIKKGIEKHRGE